MTKEGKDRSDLIAWIFLTLTIVALFVFAYFAGGLNPNRPITIPERRRR